MKIILITIIGYVIVIPAGGGLDVVSLEKIPGTLTHFSAPSIRDVGSAEIFLFTVSTSGLIKIDLIQGKWFINQLTILVFRFGIPIANVVP